MECLDAKFSKLVARGDDKVEALSRAVKRGDGRQIFSELIATYGPLEEVLFLNGPFKAKSILVFSGGVGIRVGADSYIPILTFGYHGQGASAFSAFLSEAGFSDADATAVVPPMRLRRDGTRVLGATGEDQITWQDGTTTSLDI
jgi:hypothetical protein